MNAHVQTACGKQSRTKIVYVFSYNQNQKTNGPVNAHLISWPDILAQNIQNLENIW